jgi:hypothetical protein
VPSKCPTQSGCGVCCTLVIEGRARHWVASYESARNGLGRDRGYAYDTRYLLCFAMLCMYLYDRKYLTCISILISIICALRGRPGLGKAAACSPSPSLRLWSRRRYPPCLANHSSTSVLTAPLSLLLCNSCITPFSLSSAQSASRCNLCLSS